MAERSGGILAAMDGSANQLYSSRIIDTYLKLIQSRYSFLNVADLLEYAGMKPYEVADPGYWFSQEQIDRFYERLVQLSGNPQIAREAGRYAASPGAIGEIRRYVLSLIGATAAFELANRVSSNFSRSSDYESRTLSATKVELTVTPRPGAEEKPFQCENRIGFIEAFAMMHNHEVPEIEHPECIFQGGKVCRYIVSWKYSFPNLSRRVRNIVFVPLAILALISFCYAPDTILGMILAAAISLVLLTTIVAETCEKRALIHRLNELKESTDKSIDQINASFANALLSNELGQAISCKTDVDQVLHSVVQILENRLDYDRGMILLANPERTELVYSEGFGYSGEQLLLLKKASFRLNRQESMGAFVVSFKEQRPLLINDIDEIERSLSLRSLSFARKLGTQSFICCPIISDGESIGVLAVDNLQSRRPLIQTDMSLLTGIAPMIGVSIRNAELIDAKNRQFDSLLQVMAASIDARDSLTAGHSEKVTEYVIGICYELGLDAKFKEAIRVAALLHDYGKIGVPDAILKKNGKLTDSEYDVVKTHSNRTRDILKQVNFEGIYSQVPMIAAAHHEKMDGSGYPDGLKANQIPLGAKIIAVADFFEAVTAKRHYRDPMPLEEAFSLLREGIGSHFDKKIVEAFIRYYSRNTGSHVQMRLAISN